MHQESYPCLSGGAGGAYLRGSEYVYSKEEGVYANCGASLSEWPEGRENAKSNNGTGVHCLDSCKAVCSWEYNLRGDT